MLNCDKAQELFSELHEETLAEGLRLKLARHLEDCAACTHDFAQFQKLDGLLASMSSATEPAELGEAIARRLDRVDFERRQSPARTRGLWRFGALGAAAAAMLAVAVFYQPDKGVGAVAGINNPVPVQKDGVRIEKIEGVVRIQFFAREDTRVDVFEGGHDKSTIPPVDAKQLRVDQVSAGSQYNVPVHVDAQLPTPMWLKVSGQTEAVGVFFPQPIVLTAREFEGDHVDTFQAIANIYGVIVEARMSTAGKSAQRNVQGDDAVSAARATLKGSPYTHITLSNGVLHVR